MPFVKLDCGILDSSLWTTEDPETRIVFITMLAMCDTDGKCPATAPGIAARARVPLDACRQALAKLEAPDADDRSGVKDGRRIARVEGGYSITNYLKYRDRDYGAAERQKRYRERQRNVTRNDRNVTRNVTQGEGEGEAEGEGEEEKKNTNTGASAPPRAPSRIFQKPTLEEVRAYVSEIKANVDAQAWYDHYESNGWKVGKNPMKCWKAAVRTWAKNEFRGASGNGDGKPKYKTPLIITDAMKREGRMVPTQAELQEAGLA